MTVPVTFPSLTDDPSGVSGFCQISGRHHPWRNKADVLHLKVFGQISRMAFSNLENCDRGEQNTIPFSVCQYALKKQYGNSFFLKCMFQTFWSATE